MDIIPPLASREPWAGRNESANAVSTPITKSLGKLQHQLGSIQSAEKDDRTTERKVTTVKKHIVPAAARDKLGRCHGAVAEVSRATYLKRRYWLIS
jgi:hypothetical protein